MLPRAIYRFTAITIKIPAAFFFCRYRIHPKIRIDSQGTPNCQNDLEPEQSWRPLTPGFKT